MEQFEKIEKYPPELSGRLNSFIVTEFDDSMTIEMQIRVLIKWIIKNIDLTNEMVEYLNDFIEKFDEKLYHSSEQVIIELIEEGLFNGIFNEKLLTDISNELNKKVSIDGIEQVHYQNLDTDIQNMLNKSETGIEISDGSITSKKLAKYSVTKDKLSGIVDLMTTAQIKENTYIETVDTANKLVLTETANYFTVPITLNSKGVLEFPVSNWQHGRFFAILDEFDTAIITYPFSFGSFFDYNFTKKSLNTITIDYKLLLSTYPRAKKLMITFRNDDRQTVRLIEKETMSLYDLTYIDKLSSKDVDLVLYNQPFNILTQSELVSNQQPYEVNTATKEILWSEIVSRSTYIFTPPQKGILRFPKYTLGGRYFIVLAKNDDTYIQTLNFKYTTGESSWEWLTLNETEFEINVDKMRNQFTGVEKMYLSVNNEQIKNDFYVYVDKGYDTTEFFPFIENDSIASETLVVPKRYPILTTDSTTTINLANILRYKNQFKNPMLYINNDAYQTMLGQEYRIPTAMKKLPITTIEKGIEKELAVIEIKRINEIAKTQPVSIQLLGDSFIEDFLIENDTTYSIVSYLKQKNQNFSFIGTRGQDTLKHEGRGGWSTENYLHDETYNNKTNAFYNPTKNQFDVDYYFKQTLLPYPEILVLQFAINDSNQGLGKEKFIENLQEIIRQYKQLIPTIKIIVNIPPSFPLVDNVINRSMVKRETLFELQKALIDTFEDNPSVTLNPMYLNINLVYDMRIEEKNINVYSPYSLLYATDQTHPDYKTGYRKCADRIYTAINEVLS